MLQLITDPRPPAAVVDSRVVAWLAPSIPGLMLAWTLLHWHSFRHPGSALEGAGFSLALAAVLAGGVRRRPPRASRALVVFCAGAGAALSVGYNGELSSPLSGLVLLMVAAATLAQSSREIDVGLGAAAGALASWFHNQRDLSSGIQFALVALALSLIVRGMERLLARLRDEADRDPLTGLFNRTAFAREAARRLGPPHDHARWGMVMVDLDDFGARNKRAGHMAGDAMLTSAARLLTLASGGDAVVARLGGDEFAALVPGEWGEAVAHRLLRGLATAPEPLSASIGVVTVAAGEGEVFALVRDADVALRRAKRSGKGKVVAYTEKLDGAEAAGRQRLREMIENEGIEIVVQPIVDLAQGRVYAYEALARFDDPHERSPAHWFALAERLGMRADLEAACLERSLALVDRLPANTLLTVNLSEVALRDSRIHRLLLAGRPELLIVELTEETLVRDLRSLRADIGPLLRAGIRLAVDDMGAGYSNLRQVTGLAPSLLKLDSALVRGIDADPARAALIDALGGYAQRTGAELVAEGIETQAELEVLRGLGITYGQGFHLARPAPPWPELALEPMKSEQSRSVTRGSRPVTIDVGVTGEQARRRFAALPELESLVIVDEDRRPLGLVTRYRLLTTLSTQYGQALWGSKPALSIADVRPLCVPSETAVEELARLSLARPLEHRHDPVLLLDERQRVAGQVTMGDLLFMGYIGERDDPGAPIAAIGWRDHADRADRERGEPGAREDPAFTA